MFTLVLKISKRLKIEIDGTVCEELCIKEKTHINSYKRQFIFFNLSDVNLPILFHMVCFNKLFSTNHFNMFSNHVHDQIIHVIQNCPAFKHFFNFTYFEILFVVQQKKVFCCFICVIMSCVLHVFVKVVLASEFNLVCEVK